MGAQCQRRALDSVMRICGGQHGKSVVVVMLLPYMAAPCKCAAHEAKVCANWLGGAKCGADPPDPCYLIRRLRDGKELAGCGNPREPRAELLLVPYCTDACVASSIMAPEQPLAKPG